MSLPISSPVLPDPLTASTGPHNPAGPHPSLLAPHNPAGPHPSPPVPSSYWTPFDSRA